MTEQPHYVYQLFGADGAFLYAGSTGNLSLRLQDHSRKEWWSEVDHIEIDTYPDKGSALIAERNVISESQPLYNEVFTDRDQRRTWQVRRANWERAHAAGGIRPGHDRLCAICKAEQRVHA